MSKMTLRFSQMIQDSQEYGSNDEHMVSRVFFDVVYEGKTTPANVDVKLVVGGSFLRDALEVGPPVGYEGKFDHVASSDAVTKYVRAAVGPTAHGIHLGPGVTNVRMYSNRFRFPMEVSFEVP